jgi:hypothetical protein
MLRKLRIAWSARCGIVGLLLIVMWARSYRIQDVAYVFASSGYVQLTSSCGHLDLVAVNEETFQSPFRYEARAPVTPPHTWYFYLGRALQIGSWINITVPTWLLVVIAAVVGAVPCIQWQTRFSLRTLLIAMTLIGVLLGAIICAAK